MYIIFSTIVFVAAIVQATIGFGFTPITMAFFPNMMEYNKSVGVSLIIIFVSTLIISFKYRKFVQWKILLPLLIPTFIMNGMAALINGSIVMTDAPIIGLGWVFMILGTVIGLILFKRISKELFRKIIYAFVGLNGIWIVVSNLFFK